MVLREQVRKYKEVFIEAMRQVLSVLRSCLSRSISNINCLSLVHCYQADKIDAAIGKFVGSGDGQQPPNPRPPGPQVPRSGNGPVSVGVNTGARGRGRGGVRGGRSGTTRAPAAPAGGRTRRCGLCQQPGTYL